MIYWVNRESGETYIGRANDDGSSPNQHFVAQSTLLGGGAHAGLHFITPSEDGEYIYYGVGESVSGGHWFIGRVKIDGTEPEPHFIELEIPEGALAVEQGVIQGEYIYFPWSFSGESEVFWMGRAKVDGSLVEEEWKAIPGFVFYVAANSTRLYFTNGNDFIARMKLDGTSLEPEYYEGEVEGATEAFWNGLTCDGERLYFTRGFYYAEEERLKLLICEITFENGPIATAFDTYEGEEAENCPRSLTRIHLESGNFIYAGFTEHGEDADHNGIGRYPSFEPIEADWLHLAIEAEIFSIIVTGGEETGEEETEGEGATVKVKVGGELVEAKRYVKVGGSLVSA